MVILVTHYSVVALRCRHVYGACSNSPAVKDAQVMVLPMQSCTILRYVSKAAACTTGAPFPLASLLKHLLPCSAVSCLNFVLTSSGHAINQTSATSEQNKCNMTGRQCQACVFNSQGMHNLQGKQNRAMYEGGVTLSWLLCHS